jgi:hypothetical protein
MQLLGDVSHVECRFGLFGDSVSASEILVQDRCTVCTKRTIGSEIVLDALDATPR